MDWTQFDSILDEEIMNKLTQLEEGFPDIPAGKYEVVPEDISLTVSKNNNPMTVIRLRIVAGEYKKNILFANHVMKTAFGIHKVKEFFKAMNVGEPVVFSSFGQWNSYLEGLSNEVCGKLSFVVEVEDVPNKENPDKPYKSFKILDGPFEPPRDYEAPVKKEQNQQ